MKIDKITKIIGVCTAFWFLMLGAYSVTKQQDAETIFLLTVLNILFVSWGISFSRSRLENIINQRFDEIPKRFDEVNRTFAMKTARPFSHVRPFCSSCMALIQQRSSKLLKP